MMRKFEIVSKYQNEGVIIPTRGTKQSAGYDFSSAKEVTIEPGEISLVPTGIKVFMQPDEVLLMIPRSSLALKKRLTMFNNVGVIDSDYYNNSSNEGHIMISIINHSKTPQIIAKGERFVQGIFTKYLVVEDDNTNNSRVGGFGSTK